MIRIGKMTDYGIVILTYLSRSDKRKPFSAKDLANVSKIPHSTVSQILKALAKARILISQRGLHGGYVLAKDPAQISIAEVIGHLEGPIAITDCAVQLQGACSLEGNCPTRLNWQKINKIVFDSLNGVSLADMNHTVPMTHVEENHLHALQTAGNGSV
jgi:FeS assembly SUF system regulator